MVSSPFSARSIETIRADSSGPKPAIGSSSSSMRGSPASAMASSSCRCSPWLSEAAGPSARPARPARSSAARAGARNASSLRALRQKRNECPACACTASATLSRTLRSRNSDVIWNERARPSRLRLCGGSAVMSSPAKRMRPKSARNWPLSCAINVVLPAPFGPMMACSSPGATSSERLSVATMPPKRLARPSTLSMGSLMAAPCGRACR